MKTIQKSIPKVWRILSASERAAVQTLADTGPTFQHSQLFLVMKATRLCNLRCSYCNAWRDGPNQVMSMEILEKVTREALSLPWVRHVDFVWHGGETTLLPKAFFHAAMDLQARYRGDRTVTNSIQTNATLLDEEWVSLFARDGFSVGISIDPPPERHAKYRKSKSGRDTWADSMRGVSLLRRAGVTHGFLVVINPELLAYGAERFLACLDEHEIREVGLLNVIPDNADPLARGDDYLDWHTFVDFLIEVHRLCSRRFAGRVKVRELDSLMGNLRGGEPTSCVYAGNCMGQFLTIEPSGQVSACDKFINEPDFVFGNMAQQSLDEVLVGRRLAELQLAYFDRQGDLEKCRYYKYCNGGCPHDQHLIRKTKPGHRIKCCGLARLIEVMRSEELCKR